MLSPTIVGKDGGYHDRDKDATMTPVTPAILKRRAAIERWKLNNREYYLKQKRDLSSRPSYRERVRQRYRERRNELIAAGVLPKKQVVQSCMMMKKQ